MTDALPENDDPLRWLDWTVLQQSRASNPKGSAWVSANAGSGKTHVLSQRVIRLLLSGCRPSSILCLTYTKAAAAEMANRVFQRLAEWAVLPDAVLAERIAAIEGRMPDTIMLAEARRLFARALETPGGLKIQTIHAFCEALLHQFPLEANVAGHFSVLDERAAAALLAEARLSLLTAVSAEEDAELTQAFADVLDRGDEYGLDKLIGEIVSQRGAIRRFLERAEAQGGVEAALKQAFGLAAQDSEKSILAGYLPLPGLQGAALSRYLDLAEQSGQRVQEAAEGLKLAIGEQDGGKRAEHLHRVFLTQKNEPKSDSYLISSAMKKAAPALADAVATARAHVFDRRQKLAAIGLVAATRAALTLAERLEGDYEDLKKQRSLLDFEDLIARAADLLARDDVGPWVHYKLDQGIDHILVDEAQDTSPIQWSVIKSLAEDFFAGESARQARRTLFAVGDEKQSIYSFQGARPERFAEEGREAKRKVAASGQDFHAVRLPLSFRSTPDILAAVDRVFSLDDNARGLSAGGEPVIHRSNRSGQPGVVDFWEVVAPKPDEGEDEDWTAPFDALPDRAPPAVLAGRIAHRIGEMIGRESIVEKSKERMIEPGDILVLVRKRDSFVNALTRALKRRDNIPVAGADRLKLAGHIAIQDLLALTRFLLLPQDDLSLAAVLKSPLFDLSEDNLFMLAAERPERQGLWARLKELAGQELKPFAAAAAKLGELRGLAQRLRPHDFYARLLGPLGGRRDFLARLGSEAGDILDEFLTLTLDHETGGLPGLQALVSMLELQSPEVKREQDGGRNEVRIMTVHASKGLEAPVVFLVDSGSKAFIAQHLPKFRLLETERGEIPVWLGDGGGANALVKADQERRKRAAEEEYRRLLYVGMTRAADRLTICGYRAKTENSDGWQAMVARALEGAGSDCEPARFSGPDGEWEGLRWRLSATARETDGSSGEPAEPAGKTAVELPPALMRPLPPMPVLPKPLSPSGAGAVIEDEAGDAIFTSPLFGTAEPPNLALQRGRLTHRLLQALPDFALQERPAAARRYLSRAAGYWPEAGREKLAEDVLAVLAHPGLAEAFSEYSRAEVSIIGRLRLSGREWAVSGRVDRLAFTGDRVVILDYKTNRNAPAAAEAAPLAHRAQLAIYRELLAPLYPGKLVDCVLVYVETASVVVLPPDLLTRSLQEIGAGLNTN